MCAKRGVRTAKIFEKKDFSGGIPTTIFIEIMQQLFRDLLAYIFDFVKCAQDPNRNHHLRNTSQVEKHNKRIVTGSYHYLIIQENEWDTLLQPATYVYSTKRPLK